MSAVFVAFAIALTTRGGSGIKYYELRSNGDANGGGGGGDSLPSVHFCHEYKAVGDPLSGLAVLPPQSLDIPSVEVARLLRLTASSVEPVSLMLPRSGDLKDYFQDDIYRWVGEVAGWLWWRVFFALTFTYHIHSCLFIPARNS